MSGFPEYPKIRISENPGIRISGYPHFQISGYPDIRISGYPDFRKSGYAVLWKSGFPDIRISEARKSIGCRSCTCRIVSKKRNISIAIMAAPSLRTTHIVSIFIAIPWPSQNDRFIPVIYLLLWCFNECRFLPVICRERRLNACL